MPTIPGIPSFGGGVTSGGGATAFPLPGLPQIQSRGQATVPTSTSLGRTGGVPLDDELQSRLLKILSPSPAGAETTVDTGIGMRTEPPATPEEKEQRKKGFRALLDRLATDPNAQQAMLMAAAQILQPIQDGSGETALTRLVQGALVGTSSFRGLTQEQEDRDMQARKDELAIESAELNLETKRTQADATEKLITSVRNRTDLSEQQKEMFELTAQTGNLSTALSDLGVDEEAQVLTAAETEQQFGGRLSAGTVVVRKTDGNFAVIHTPENPSGDTDAKQREIERMVPVIQRLNPEMTEVEATDRATLAAYEMFVVDVDDDGTVVRVNKVDSGPGEQVPVRLPGESPTAAGGVAGDFGENITVAPGGNEIVPPDQAIVGAITEAGQGIPAIYHSVVANIPIFKNNTTDRQSAAVYANTVQNIVNRDIIRARILSERNAVTEQKIIEGEASLKRSFWKNPASQRDVVRALDDEFKIKIQQNERALANNMIPNFKEKSRVRESVRLMKDLRERLGVQRFDDLNSALESGSARTFQDLSEAEKRFYYVTSTEDEWMKLPIPVLEAFDEWKNANR